MSVFIKVGILKRVPALTSFHAHAPSLVCLDQNKILRRYKILFNQKFSFAKKLNLEMSYLVNRRNNCLVFYKKKK